MRLLSRILWVFVLWGFSLFLYALALGLVPLLALQEVIFRLYDSARLRWGLGAAATLFLVLGFLLLRFSLRQRSRERTIAFDNPDGEVTVALEAIEEFIKQLGSEQEGVQELKARAFPDRGGVLIQLQAGLWSTCHIPETTEHLQNVIRAHVHEILGVEGPVTVRVHVGKVERAPRHDAGSGAPQQTFAEKMPG